MAVAQILTAIKRAAWLGWKIESNWTDPVLFTIYYLVRPLSGLLIVGFIYLIGSAAAGSVDPTYFAYIFVGNTFYVYVFHITFTMSYLIHEDRARYEVLKHIYISPHSIHPYLLGRALTSALDGTLSVFITFSLGYVIFAQLLGTPLALTFTSVNLLTLVLGTALGIVSLIFVGYILCGINLVSSKLQWTLSEYVGGIFFLFGGVVFPVSALPTWLQPVSHILPVTYFLNVVRDSIFGAASEQLARQITLLLLSTTAVTALGLGVFKWAETRARKLGIIDRKAEY